MSSKLKFVLAISLFFGLVGAMPSNADAQSCPPVEVVFVMDTSGSMTDEAVSLCNTITAVQSELALLGIQSTVHHWAHRPFFLNDWYYCNTSTVLESLGSAVPGDANSCSYSLEDELGIETWGPATAIVAERFPWQAGAIRVVVPLSDEGACGGNPCLDPGEDRDSIENAIDVAVANNVIVSPIIGTNRGWGCAMGLATDLAAGTGGVAMRSLNDETTVANAVRDLVVSACETGGTTNQPPEARCTDRVVTADATCAADASIDNGSSDPDGDALTIHQNPPGPYTLGTTPVTMTVEDGQGNSATCQATVTVNDETPPVIDCNAPATIAPRDAPITFTASAVDACGPVSAQVRGFDCHTFTKKGKRIDKRQSCIVAYSDADLVVQDSGGVGDIISWTVSSTDGSGNTSEKTCSVEVINPNR